MSYKLYIRFNFYYYFVAYFLNPRFQCKEGIDTDSDLVQAIHDVFAVLDPNLDHISQFGNEVRYCVLLFFN